MEKQRREFGGQGKVKILREHLLEKVGISQVCERHEIEPTLFYAWQKVAFENGATAFERTGIQGVRPCFSRQSG
jgi:transposase